MMNCCALSLRAGQTGRLRFSISPEGDYTLAGAVHAQGADVPMEADGDDLLIPPLPVGLHLVEVRANGRTVLYGGLEALPSPLEGTLGEVCWSIHADLAESVASISVSLAEGLPGPQGEPGEPGEDGTSAYEAWLAAGNDGSEADFLASLRPTPDELEQAAEGALCDIVPAESATPAGTANATCQYIELDAQHVPQGKLQSVSLRCRTGNNPAARSHLALWELGEDGETWSYLGSSSNAPAQTMNTTSVWEYEEGAISLAGRPLRLLPQAERSDAWEIGPQLGVRTTPTPEGDATRCYNNGTGYAFLPELSIAARRPVPKYAPAAHAEDATVHVTAEEREAWNAKAAAAVDTAPKSGSANAVSSGGVYDALHQLNRGRGDDSVAIGPYTSADEIESIAIGAYTTASGRQSIAIGRDVNACRDGSVAIGHLAYVADSGCVGLSAPGQPGYTTTQLFLIPAGSDLSVTYLDGEAGLGYVVHSGSYALDHIISQAGCRKLRELLTDHASDFTPTGFHW